VGAEQQVEQHHVGRQRLGEGSTLLGGRRRSDDVHRVVTSEHAREQLSRRGVVIDDKDAHGCHLPPGEEPLDGDASLPPVDRGGGAAAGGPTDVGPVRRAAGSEGDGGTVDSLGRIVDELRAEVAGLRRALRYRAVIEQAKGVLVARSGVLPDHAFAQLVRRSQEINRKLTTVAAAVVADAIRSTDADRPDAGSRQVDTGEIKVELAAAAFASAPDLDALTRSVIDELADLEVQAAVLFACEPDGALRLLDAEGMEPGAVRGWERIPPTVDVPLTEAARTGRPVLLRDRETRLTRHPGSRRIPSTAQATASLPLFTGERLLGVLGLTWTGPVDFDQRTTERLTATAARCAPRLHALLAAHGDELEGFRLEPGYDRWLHDLLDDLGNPVVLLEPVRRDGRIVDLTLVHATPACGWDGLPPGTSALTERPWLAGTELFERVRLVFETGLPWRTPTFELPPAADAPGITYHDLRLRRLASLLVVTWQDAHVTDPQADPSPST
jgi:hypothetical protein